MPLVIPMGQASIGRRGN